MTSTATDLTVAAWPDCAPRLLRPTQAKTEELAEYVQAGGYAPLGDPDALLEHVDLAGLLGRGGAAFPLGTKLRTVRDAGRRGVQTVIVANGERVNQPRSKTAGCCATGRTWFWTVCGWRPRSSMRVGRMCMSPTNSRPSR